MFLHVILPKDLHANLAVLAQWGAFTMLLLSYESSDWSVIPRTQVEYHMVLDKSRIFDFRMSSALAVHEFSPRLSSYLEDTFLTGKGQSDFAKKELQTWEQCSSAGSKEGNGCSDCIVPFVERNCSADMLERITNSPSCSGCVAMAKLLDHESSQGCGLPFICGQEWQTKSKGVLNQSHRFVVTTKGNFAPSYSDSFAKGDVGGICSERRLHMGSVFKSCQQQSESTLLPCQFANDLCSTSVYDGFTAIHIVSLISTAVSALTLSLLAIRCTLIPNRYHAAPFCRERLIRQAS